MSELEEIERDLREYLEKEPNLRKADRLSYLMSIFSKRMELQKLDYIVNYRDFFQIINQAKSFYVHMKLPVRISTKQLEPNDAVHVATLESFIMYLNKNSVLKKFVKFDFTE